MDSNEAQNQPTIDQSIDDEDSSDSNQGISSASKEKQSESNSSGDVTPECEQKNLVELQKSMVSLALKLVQIWNNLKEAFRIPKNKRLELMKEHEREVDKAYKVLLDRGEVFEKRDR